MSLGQRMDLLRATPVGGRFGPSPNISRSRHLRAFMEGT